MLIYKNEREQTHINSNAEWIADRLRIVQMAMQEQLHGQAKNNLVNWSNNPL